MKEVELLLKEITALLQDYRRSFYRHHYNSIHSGYKFDLFVPILLEKDCVMMQGKETLQ